MPNPIDNITPVPDPQRTQRSERTSSQQTDNRSEAAPTEDRVEISGAGQQARAEQERLQEAAQNAPDVREDRVAEVRARIASGELDSIEVRRVIADRLLDQFGV